MPPKIRVPNISFRKSAKKAIKALFDNDANYQRIVDEAPYATPGSRALPQNVGANDANYGARLDWGEKFQKADGHWYRNLVLQPNKNAADSTLKKLAAANSHMSLAKVEVRADGTQDATWSEFQESLLDAVDARHDELGL